MVSISEPQIFFDDLPVYAGTFDFFNASLNKRVIVDGNRESKYFALPVTITVVFKVLNILIAIQSISSASGIKLIGRIFGQPCPVLHESEMCFIDDLDHALIFCVVSDRHHAAGNCSS